MSSTLAKIWATAGPFFSHVAQKRDRQSRLLYDILLIFLTLR